MERKLKICQITNSGGWTGGINQMFLMSREFQKMGHKVTVVSPPKSILSEKIKPFSIPHYPVKMKADGDLPAMIKLALFLRRKKFDVVHSNHSRAHSIALAASAIAGVAAYVVTRRVMFPLRRHPFSKLKYKSKRIDAYIAVSENIKKILADYGIPPKKIRVIPDACNIDFVKTGKPGKLRKEFSIPEENFIITTVANYSYRRGHQYLLLAAKKIKKEMKNATFFIAGSGTETLKDFCKKQNISDFVILAGFRKDVPDILASSDCFVLPTLSEGMGGCLLEAMAAGVPVVATDVGGIPDIIKDGFNGFLVQPRNPDAIARAVIKIARDAELRRKFSEKGKKFVQNFSIENSAKKIIALYEEILKKKGK